MSKLAVEWVMLTQMAMFSDTNVTKYVEKRLAINNYKFAHII